MPCKLINNVINLGFYKLMIPAFVHNKYFLNGFKYVKPLIEKMCTHCLYQQ